MKKIKLTKGRFTLVDDKDFEFLNQWKWHLSTSGYAVRNIHVRIGINKYTRCRVWMHRMLNKTPDELFTDHINRNKLDNRKCNLRSVTKSVNSFNRDKNKNNKSGTKGVYFDSWSNKWRAEIKKDGKKFTLGRFISIKDAIKARLKAEKIYCNI
ncbi:MAG: AP2 domain-containing protein [Methanogenium sp.]|jgi:hypothetical protein